MKDGINSILIHEADDVATTVTELKAGDTGRYLKGKQLVEVAIRERIPQYHKYSVRNIRKMEEVRKYGEIIGRATQAIGAGMHVHVHNLASPGGQVRDEL
jgi:altronate dehydratase small subunit